MVLQELFVALVLCAVAFAWAARQLRVPYPVMLVAGGGMLGFVPELPPLQLDPDLALAFPVTWSTCEFVSTLLGKICADGNCFPRVDGTHEVAELGADSFQSIPAENQIDRWRGALHHLDDGVRGAHRIAWLFAAATSDLGPPRTGCIRIGIHRVPRLFE